MNIFFTILGVGVVGVIFWLLRQSRQGAKCEVVVEAMKLDKERKAKSNEMEKDHDEETEKILRDMDGARGNGNSRVRSPHLRERDS